MEWFSQIQSVGWRTAIVYLGALALIGIVTVLLTQLTLGFLGWVIPHPKMWIINKDGTRKRVWKFPYEDMNFYAYMLKMKNGERLLVKIQNTARDRYTNRLFIRMTSDHDILTTDESILTSTKTIEKGKYLITSVSYKQRDWILQLHEDEKECKYTLTSLD